MGTSLTVYPFAGLTQLVRKSCPRVLINLDPVGDIGSRVDDVVLLGKCDDIIQNLCRLLGWEEELEELWAETASSLDPQELDVDVPAPTLDEEVKKLTDEIEETLEISEKLKEEVQKLAQVSNTKTPFKDEIGVEKDGNDRSGSKKPQDGSKTVRRESTEELNTEKKDFGPEEGKL